MPSSQPQSFPSTPSYIVDHFLFVFHIDLALLSLFALYVAWTLPRTLAYLFQPSEVLNGFFLHSGSSRTPHRAYSIDRFGSARATIKPVSLINTRTNQAAPTFVDIPGDGADGEANRKAPLGSASRPALIVPKRSGRDTHRLMPFMASPNSASTRGPLWTTIVHSTFVYVLNFRVAPGFSFGKLLVLLAYAGFILYASLFRTNPFIDPVRMGWVAVSQIPIAVALAGKTNLLSWACGVGYEKLNFIHRFSGRVIIIAANVHGLGHLYTWALAGTIRAQMRIPKFFWGLVAICAIDFLFAGSLSFVRNRMYTLFVTIHVTGFAVLFFAIHKHSYATLPYILVAVGLYAFDHLVRIARTRYTTAWLVGEHVLNGGTTLVHAPSLGAGWRAGQHVRLRVASGAWFSWWATWFVGRPRPFTVAVGSDSGGMMLPVKAQGSWTRSLLRMSGEAADVHLEEKFANAERGGESARKVHIIVEGPYSGPGYTRFTAYSGAVLVAGGSGISYVMGVLDDMLRKHARGESRVCVIEVIWSVMNPDSLYSLLPELIPLMQPHSSRHTSLSLRCNVHWTRASPYPPVVQSRALPPGMYLSAGRPDIHATLQSAIAGVRTAYSTSQNRGSDVPSGVVIGSCGPTSLIDDAVRAVGRVSWTDWKGVGGVESIEEVFGW